MQGWSGYTHWYTHLLSLSHTHTDTDAYTFAHVTVHSHSYTTTDTRIQSRCGNSPGFRDPSSVKISELDIRSEGEPRNRPTDGPGAKAFQRGEGRASTNEDMVKTNLMADAESTQVDHSLKWKPVKLVETTQGEILCSGARQSSQH